MRRIKILFIGGQGRSGSTLLDRLLGQIPHVISTGEIRHLWDRSLPEDQYCGCGSRFRHCPFWTEVLARTVPVSEEHVAGYEELIQRVDRIRNIPGLSRPYLRSQRLKRCLEAYQRALLAVFRSIHSLTGSRVIVDSSKYPSHGYILNTIPEVDLHVLHLVRDARAVAHSWTRKKYSPNTIAAKRLIPRYSVTRTALAWDVSNALVQALGRRTGRYMRVRYEDLVQRPHEVIRGIVTALDEPEPELEFLRNQTAELTVQHTVAGNPMRFEKGSVELREDAEWRCKMTARQKFAVTALTWPLLLRYGYR